MTPQFSLDKKLWPAPLPQVGAVLYLDTEIDPPDYTGGKRWKLTGSCVLVAPDKILTVGHTLTARSEILPEGHYAAFFPYVGLVPIHGLQWEDKQLLGDNLALATLATPVKSWQPFRPFYESRKGFRRSASAWVCGYGIWKNSPLSDLEGLQQQHLVPLGPPKKKWRMDNLDVSWSSERNGGMAMGRGNSGGPLLWSDPLLVIGINREVLGDQQMASRITRDRMNKWLDAALSLSSPAPPPPPAPETAWKLLQITADQDVVTQLKVPEGTKSVRATLNASAGLRLRMDLPGSPQTATGRFLSREAPVTEGQQVIDITVGRAPRSPFRTDAKVLAQLCVLFE
jgi:hypothetical protein